jgi:predicted xylose isomerase-like sugar epimerase
VINKKVKGQSVKNKTARKQSITIISVKKVSPDNSWVERKKKKKKHQMKQKKNAVPPTYAEFRSDQRESTERKTQLVRQ